MSKAYKSKAMAALHENVSDLYRVGMIDKKTMRKFDAACLTPVRILSPAAIRGIRAKADVSQAVFAAHLNVTAGMVEYETIGLAILVPEAAAERCTIGVSTVPQAIVFTRIPWGA